MSNLSGSALELCEFLNQLVEHEYIETGIRDCRGRDEHRGRLTRTTLGCGFPPSMIDQDLTHRYRRDRDEVRVALPSCPGAELEPRLVHECRRLEGVRSVLLREMPPREGMELGVELTRSYQITNITVLRTAAEPANDGVV